MKIPSPPPLLSLANSLRSGELSLDEYLAQLENQFAQWESEVKAFLPEQNRFERLRRQALPEQAARFRRRNSKDERPRA